MCVAVTEKAAKKDTKLFTSAFNNLKSLFTSPKVFLTKPTFLFVCVVYGGTYLSANVISTLAEFQGKDPFWYKLMGTTAVNMGLGVMKDKYFAQVFSGKPATKFPAMSWGLFVCRDLLTIGAGFNLPALASSYALANNIFPMLTKAQTQKVVQIGVPMSAQLFLTPIHLLALDFYNNKVSNASARSKSVFSVYPEATTIRMGRVLCAYGIAGIANIGLRTQLRETFVIGVNK
jgi:hypothetical protein